MRQVIEHYYSLYPGEVINKNNHYFFECDNQKYLFLPYNRDPSDLKYLYQINNYAINQGLDFHKIIVNNSNYIITEVDGNTFILLKISIINNVQFNLFDIQEISQKTANITDDLKIKNLDTIELWSQKIDYFEYQISQYSSKYLKVCENFSYYMGLAENAISYLVNNKKYQNESDKKVVAHRRMFINGTLYDLYNPLEVVVDHYARDLAEYIKIKFFYEKNPIAEVKDFFDKNTLSQYGYISFLARLLYPSYYFDLLEQIFAEIIEEKEIDALVYKTKEYERFINQIIALITEKTSLPKIEWLNP